MRHGVRLSGMPAWEYRLPDEDLWALTAFVVRLPDWSPLQWRSEQARLEGQQCAASR